MMSRDWSAYIQLLTYIQLCKSVRLQSAASAVTQAEMQVQCMPVTLGVEVTRACRTLQCKRVTLGARSNTRLPHAAM